ncbi:MAG: hypothetical protein WBE34_07165 [Candidatus Nitrosopolaris sp.]
MIVQIIHNAHLGPKIMSNWVHKIIKMNDKYEHLNRPHLSGKTSPATARQGSHILQPKQE